MGCLNKQKCIHILVMQALVKLNLKPFNGEGSRGSEWLLPAFTSLYNSDKSNKRSNCLLCFAFIHMHVTTLDCFKTMGKNKNMNV